MSDFNTVEGLVSSLYRSLLDREPDGGGLAHYSASMNSSSGHPVFDAIRSISSSDEFLKKFVSRHRQRLGNLFREDNRATIQNPAHLANFTPFRGRRLAELSLADRGEIENHHQLLDLLIFSATSLSSSGRLSRLGLCQWLGLGDLIDACARAGLELRQTLPLTDPNVAHLPSLEAIRRDNVAEIGYRDRIVAVGDSHTRFLAGIDTTEAGADIPQVGRLYANQSALFDAYHVGPGLAFTLNNHGSRNGTRERIERLFATSLRPETRVIFSFGEIDCRFHVCQQAEKLGLEIDRVVDGIITEYVKFLEFVQNAGHRLMVFCPPIVTASTHWGDPDHPVYGGFEQRKAATNRFSSMLKEACELRRITVVDLRERTSDAEGRPIESFICDPIHLSQNARIFLHRDFPGPKTALGTPYLSHGGGDEALQAIVRCLKKGGEERPVIPTTFKKNGAWTWFQDERVIVSGDKIWIGTTAGVDDEVSHAGSVELTIVDLKTGHINIVTLHDRLQIDDHNAPCFLALPDGRILAGYQAHPAPGLNDADLWRWRQTERPDTVLDWSAERTISMSGRVTYCHLIRLEQEGGRIYSFVRGPDNKPHYLVSDDCGKSFRHIGKLLSWDFDARDPRYSGRDGTRPYVKYVSDGVDSVHILAVEDHPRAWTNSLWHGVLRADSIHASDGSRIGPAGKGGEAPVRVDALTKVFAGDENRIVWPMDFHLDRTGCPVALFSVRADDRDLRRSGEGAGRDHRYYRSRWNGSVWKTTELCFAGSCLYDGEEDFTGLAAMDPDETETVFVSTDCHPLTGQALISRADGKRHFEIFRGKLDPLRSLWKWRQVTEDSTCDNIRPTIPPWPGERRVVLWMRGAYRHYVDFETDIIGFIETR